MCNLGRANNHSRGKMEQGAVAEIRKQQTKICGIRTNATHDGIRASCAGKMEKAAAHCGIQ